MKRLFVLAFMFVSLYVRPGVEGYYWHGLIFCADHASCVHEVGHMLDDRAGWISQSLPYRKNVAIYLAAQMMYGPDPVKPIEVVYVLFNPDHPDAQALRELYATMFEQANGRPEGMPTSFKRFYDWPQAVVLLREYAP